jgi:hypothetical protein
MSADDVLVRQLKFSFILQLVGAGLFAVATIIRIVLGGLDITAIVFLIATVLISTAAVFTRKRIQQITG